MAKKKKNTQDNRLSLSTIDETRDYIDKVIGEMNKDTYNFALLYSGRGIGKTYTVQKRLIKEAITNDFEIGFVVLKAKEIQKKALFGWIEKCWRKEFDDFYELKISKQEILWRRREDDDESDWKRLLYIFSICESDEYKIMSFPRMKYLIWDECVKAKMRPEDTMAMYNFINIYETIDREQNELKAILMCNVLKTAKVSPVFDYFHVPTTVMVNEFQVVDGRFSVYLPTFIDNKDFAKGVLGYEGMTNGEFETFNYHNLLATPEKPKKNQIPVEYSTSKVIYIDSNSYIYAVLTTNKQIYIELLTGKDKYQVQMSFDDDNKCFTTDLLQVSRFYQLIPPVLITYLKNALISGKLKFCTEETLLRPTELLNQLGLIFK